VHVGGFNIAGYMLFQHGSTLLGFPVFVLLFRQWYRNAPVHAAPPQQLGDVEVHAWQTVLLGTPCLLIAFALARCLRAATPVRAYFRLVDGVTLAGFVLIVLLACFALYFAMATRGRQAAREMP